MKKALVVMAAGMGSRFGGLKQLKKFGKDQKTLLDFAVEDAISAGFSEVCFVIRKDIEDAFKSEVSKKYEGKIEVLHAFQSLENLPSGYVVPEGRTKPWGTGQAVLSCKGIVKTPFLAINSDDYYGRDVYEIMGRFLDEKKSNTFALAGYKLGNTLSENGGVSRGICKVDESGFLVDVEEHTGLSDCGGGFVKDEFGERFSLDTLVSMNFWAFGTSIFDILESGFEEFLRENSANLKSEFYLPFAVDNAVKCGKVKVRVIPNSEKWQGVTYREDIEAVEKFLIENR